MVKYIPLSKSIVFSHDAHVHLNFLIEWRLATGVLGNQPVHISLKIGTGAYRCTLMWNLGVILGSVLRVKNRWEWKGFLYIFSH